MSLLIFLMVAGFMAYTVMSFIRSRRNWSVPQTGPNDLFFVFMVPCLNEEFVLGRTLQNLLDQPGSNFAVMVIDDGSDDQTAAIARSFDPERVWVFQRTAPEARQGKGEALNAAYRYLTHSDVLKGRDPKSVVVAIFDADGRIQRNAIFETSRYFSDPKTAAVQIGVRMYNADHSLLTRMQDMEFVVFTEIFQRSRQHLGSVGMGGNGQFCRLEALQSLGDAPWTDCLTEDLDLGVRLLLGGWSNRFAHKSYVSQQAVTDARRLVRQRARWFQGHLQCWSLIPKVVASNLSGNQVNDLTYHLSSPAIVLLTGPAVVMFMAVFTVALVAAPGDTVDAMLANNGLALGLSYMLSFGLAPFYALVYWLQNQKSSFLKSLFYAHLFVLYGYLWFPAGWMAAWKIVRRSKGWVKTTRTVDPDALSASVEAGDQLADSVEAGDQLADSVEAGDQLADSVEAGDQLAHSAEAGDQLADSVEPVEQGAA